MSGFERGLNGQRFAGKHARHDSHTTGRPSAQLNPPQVMAATDPICCRDPRNVMTASRPATYRSFLPDSPQRSVPDRTRFKPSELLSQRVKFKDYVEHSRRDIPLL
jgi:hypothetical protein